MWYTCKYLKEITKYALNQGGLGYREMAGKLLKYLL